MVRSEGMGQERETRTAIIACGTIRPELEAVMDRWGCRYPVIYMDPALHDRPEALRREVQARLDTLTETDRVLLPFGYCGGTTVGLRSGSFEMILPKAADCITLFLGSEENRKAVPEEKHTFFLTQGWLASERNILKEYSRLREAYGEKRADRIMGAMYGNLHTMALVDAGLFPLEPQVEMTRQIAGLLHMEARVLPGTPGLLQKLLRGPWEEDFVRIGPYEEVTKGHFGYG